MPETRICSTCAAGTEAAYQSSSAAPQPAAIARAAALLVRSAGWSYAKSEAPVSPYRNLSGNTAPGVTRIAWLRGLNKCNQFVGDALSAAGFAMPTVRMQDGSEHYALAETLPRQRRFFRPLAELSAVRPGDVFVRDYGGADGACGAHAEVVVARDGATGALTLAGAHRSGAGFSRFLFDPRRWHYDHELRGWSDGSDTLFFLRPLRLSPAD